MPKVNQPAIAQMPIPIPPYPEQRRIVEAIDLQLSRIDAAVAALRRTQANLKRYRASMLKAACEGRLFSPAEKAPRPDDSGSLPEGWRWMRLSDVAEIQGGIQKQPKRAPREHAYPFLRVANVLRGRLDLSEVHRIELFEGEIDRLRLEKGDLLVVEGNGSPSEIGRMAIWSGAISDCVHQNHIIRARLRGDVVPEFIQLYWNSLHGTAALRDVASSTSGLYTLSVHKVGKIAVPIPPSREQVRIVAEVDRLLSPASALENQVVTSLRGADRLRQSLLQRAFEGKLVPQDPSDEPASVLLARIRAQREAAESKTPARQRLAHRPAVRRRPEK